MTKRAQARTALFAAVRPEGRSELLRFRELSFTVDGVFSLELSFTVDGILHAGALMLRLPRDFDFFSSFLKQLRWNSSMVFNGVDHLSFPIPASASFDPRRLGNDFVFVICFLISMLSERLLLKWSDSDRGSVFRLDLLLEAIWSSELKDFDFIIGYSLEALVSRGK
jgi:hypothetical protein